MTEKVKVSFWRPLAVIGSVEGGAELFSFSIPILEVEMTGWTAGLVREVEEVFECSEETWEGEGRIFVGCMWKQELG